MGPDLTDAWKRLNPDWMVQWIKNPQAFDPASLMPNLGVADAEAIALVAYLENVSRQMTAQAGSGTAWTDPSSADPAVMCRTSLHGDDWLIDLPEGIWRMMGPI